MNKQGLTQIESIGIGLIIGVSGLITMSFGASLGSDFMLRTGIVLTTIGGWLIGWSK